MGKDPKIKGKSLCKISGKKFIKDHIEEYTALVEKPKYLCTKCGRVCRRKKNLCDPHKI